MTTSGKQQLDEKMPQIGESCLTYFSQVNVHCKKEFHVPFAAVGLREGRHLHLYFAQGQQQRLLVEDSICGLPLSIPGEQIIINDLHSLPEEFQPQLAAALGIRSYIGIPLFVQQELVGSLNLADLRPRQFLQPEVQKLKHRAQWLSHLVDLYL